MSSSIEHDVPGSRTAAAAPSQGDYFTGVRYASWLQSQSLPIQLLWVLRLKSAYINTVVDDRCSYLIYILVSFFCSVHYCCISFCIIGETPICRLFISPDWCFFRDIYGVSGMMTHPLRLFSTTLFCTLRGEHSTKTAPLQRSRRDLSVDSSPGVRALAVVKALRE